MVLNALVGSFLPQSEKYGTERVKRLDENHWLMKNLLASL